jgi:hypothetical protein
MAVIIYTDTPQALLTKIKRAIDGSTVRTWAYDTDGDFTHTAEQWIHRAWMRPRIENEKLIFNVLTPQGQTLSTELYAIYHGRFIEMLLAHFDRSFTWATSSALPKTPDRVKG